MENHDPSDPIRNPISGDDELEKAIKAVEERYSVQLDRKKVKAAGLTAQNSDLAFLETVHPPAYDSEAVNKHTRTLQDVESGLLRFPEDPPEPIASARDPLPSTPPVPVSRHRQVFDEIQAKAQGGDLAQRARDFEAEAPAGGSGKLSRSQMTLLAGAVLVAVLGVVAASLWPSSTSAPSKTSIAPTQASAPSTPASAPATAPTAPSTAPAPASAPGDLVTPQVTVTAGTQGPSLESGAFRSAMVSADELQPLPPQEQTCESSALSTYDQAICGQVGRQKFFQCTRGNGRVWDVTIRGCENG